MANLMNCGNSLLNGEWHETYIQDVILSNISVSPDEIYTYYNLNKNKLFTKRNAKNINIIIPFDTAQSKIKFRLLKQKKTTKRKEWELNLLKQNEYSINESELI